jgi:hemerythrin
MDKIVLLESIGMLKLVIERIFRDHRDVHIEMVSKVVLDAAGINRLVRNASLVIMDADHLSGQLDDFVKGIRGGNENPLVPLVFLTSYPTRDLLLKVAGLRPAEMLAKPFSDTELLEKVLKHRASPQWGNIRAHGPEHQERLEERVALTWNDGYVIGIPEVDEAHKGIVDRFEQLYDLMKSGQGHAYYHELLSFLRSYVDTHFSQEEALQNRMGFPYLQEHRKSHEQFKEQVVRILEQQNDKEVSNQDLIRLNLFIKEWLIHHILVEDKRMGAYLTEKDVSSDRP